jgi:small subunit ribosomal protein S8
MNNYLWNMFTNIKNGQLIKRTFILQRKTKICEQFLRILWDEGFILGYKTVQTNKDQLKIFLKYKNGTPVINSLKLISKPGLRVYYSVKQLWKFNSTEGILILSTNKGVLSINECKKKKVGGEPFVIVK